MSAKLLIENLDFQKGLNFLNSKNKESVVIGHNIALYSSRANGKITSVEVLLHTTYILCFKDTGKIILNSGGYTTKITKDRMNKLLPTEVKVESHNSKWYVRIGKSLHEFKDGMEISL